MRNGVDEVCGCFPTGRHYPGIAEDIADVIVRVEGLMHELTATHVWLEQPFAVIDFETTGLDHQNDRVLEMAIVWFRGGVVEKAQNWLINPTIPVPEESRKVHGIGDEELRGAPTFAEVADEIEQLLDGRIPVAYNAEFDRRFLHAEFSRLKRGPAEHLVPALRPSVTWIDPLVWVREFQKYEKGKKLTDVVARMGITLEKAHRAAGDAEAAGRVLLGLADKMPKSYGELVRLQMQYGARQEAELQQWRKRRSETP
ncbi:MAG: 3'-5' exonuclease [Sandaracinaceae bacterium]|jgi:DNA polymerase-3 subunit epsilon|nr:3'-5' exonuclease [Sandaracinaceae bacterium]